MINHIFLDLDGVITDFATEYGSHTREEWVEAFPAFVQRGGFVGLKKLPDADELMEFLDSLEIPITILSSAGGFTELYHDIVAQKHQWLANHDIRYPALVVPTKSVKAFYATLDSVLIDDQQVNTHNFWKHGGMGITHTSTKETIEQLKVYLND